MMLLYVILFIWANTLRDVRCEASFDICYLIDEIQDGQPSRHGIEEKLQLARNISRCLLSKRSTTKISAIMYDNTSARLEFRFKTVSEVLSDDFGRMLLTRRQRRSSPRPLSGDFVKHRKKHLLFLRNIIRSKIGHEDYKAAKSPQSMAFLTAAESMMVQEAYKDDQDSHFKVLVISDSNVFHVVHDVKEYFSNASIEINAMDISEKGSPELKDTVTLPSSEHYLHNPLLNDQRIVQDICVKLLKVPTMEKGTRLPFTKLLNTTPEKEVSSPIGTGDKPDDHSPSVADFLADQDGSIESDSYEYKWSQEPRFESESPEVDKEEKFLTKEMEDICKYFHEECSFYTESGLCSDTADLKGLRNVCKSACGYCN